MMRKGRKLVNSKNNFLKYDMKYCVSSRVVLVLRSSSLSSTLERTVKKENSQMEDQNLGEAC